MTTAPRSEIKNNNKLEALHLLRKENLHVHHVNDLHSIFYTFFLSVNWIAVALAWLLKKS